MPPAGKFAALAWLPRSPGPARPRVAPSVKRKGPGSKAPSTCCALLSEAQAKRPQEEPLSSVQFRLPGGEEAASFPPAGIKATSEDVVSLSPHPPLKSAKLPGSLRPLLERFQAHLGSPLSSITSPLAKQKAANLATDPLAEPGKR